jgi:hypothetical protein
MDFSSGSLVGRYSPAVPAFALSSGPDRFTEGEIKMLGSTVTAAMRAGALLIALVAFGPGAMAQGSTPSPASVQIAREFVLASGATRTFEGVVPTILQQSLGVFVQQNPDLQKQLTETVKSIAPEFEKRGAEIIDLIARVYATRFTEAELKEILAFYRSPVGKKFVVQQPSVLEESFVKTQEWGGKLSEEIVVRLRAEMKKKGHTI